jgi:hypothetical protein
MTTQGKEARNKAPPQATQTETLQCGTSAEACCAPRIQPERPGMIMESLMGVFFGLTVIWFARVGKLSSVSCKLSIRLFQRSGLSIHLEALCSHIRAKS